MPLQQKIMYLTPSLLVPDLILVLQVSHDLRLAGQGPHQPPSVRGGDPLGGPDADGRLVDVLGSFIDEFDQKLHEAVHDVLLFIAVTDLERVVKENVR